MTAATIFALSSGAPPAAIAVIRISGPEALPFAAALAGQVPPPRRAELRTLRDPACGDVLDRALVLLFPGPNSATGEDLVELHLHGGRAVVRAVSAALSAAGLREAEPGEFTRRAFEHGRIDLAEAEGLADLLEAETEMQRRAALSLAGGALSGKVEEWQTELLRLSAAVEAELDFSDEGDVHSPFDDDGLAALIEGMKAMLARPPAERLRDGVRVAVAGPPNAGKSSLLNYLAQRDVAITSPVPGTTRDLLEAPIALEGVPFLLVDTAGLREGAGEIERIGIGRAERMLASADIILWLGEPREAPRPECTIRVQTKADLSPPRRPDTDLLVSSKTGFGMERLLEELLGRARSVLPRPGDVAVNARHRSHILECSEELEAAATSDDLLVRAEHFRSARRALDRITGRAGVEDMLDALFGRFCIGK